MTNFQRRQKNGKTRRRVLKRLKKIRRAREKRKNLSKGFVRLPTSVKERKAMKGEEVAKRGEMMKEENVMIERRLERGRMFRQGEVRAK